MNSSGCPPGVVTDEAFQLTYEQACETSLAGFYVYLSIIAALKYISTAKQTTNWYARRKHQQEGNYRHQRKIPLGPIVSFSFASIYIALTLLLGFDIINYRNGLSFMLYSIGFLPFAWGYTMGLVRVVRLGEKIIPRSHRGEHTDGKLRTFDRLGKTLLTIQTISIAISSLVLIILSPILHENATLLARLGFGLKAAFMTSSAFGWVYQYQRCINSIVAIQRNIKGVRMEGSSSSGKTNGLDKVTKKMRSHQILQLVMITPAIVILFLLAIAAIPANVFVVFAPSLFEAIGTVLQEFVVNRKRSGLSEKNQNGDDNDANAFKTSAIVIGDIQATNASATDTLPRGN